MADTDTDTARRLAEIERLCADPHTAFHQFDYVYNHTRWLLAQLAAKDRELAELRGVLADLCEDSRAAAAAVRYRRALERLATIPPFGGRGDDWDELCPEVRRIANEALKGEPP